MCSETSFIETTFNHQNRQNPDSMYDADTECDNILDLKKSKLRRRQKNKLQVDNSHIEYSAFEESNSHRDEIDNSSNDDTTKFYTPKFSDSTCSTSSSTN